MYVILRWKKSEISAHATLLQVRTIEEPQSYSVEE